MSKYTEIAFETLARLVKIDSVTTEPAPNAPFGTKIRAALDSALALCREQGFHTVDVDGYAGYAEWSVGAEQTVGILTHLDVVPIGNGWKHAQGEIENGVLYGRGATDDKGGFVASLFALKKLKDSGFVPERNIRLIFGCDEESGSRCMAYFKERVGMPDIGFSPDSDFPLIRFEKTILHLEVTLPLPPSVLEWNAGERANVVPDTSTAVTDFPFDGAVADSSATYRRTDIGRAAHAMEPWLGESAVWQTAEALLPRIDAAEPLAKLIALCRDNAVDTLGIRCDDDTGCQTINIGILASVKNSLSVTFDLRCPRTQDVERVKERLGNHFGTLVKTLHHSPYLSADEHGELYTKLFGVWKKLTVSDAVPKVSGGGTYARAMKNCVAFGPSLPGVDNRIHDSDEFLSYGHLDFLIDIYCDAVRELSTINGRPKGK